MITLQLDDRQRAVVQSSLRGDIDLLSIIGDLREPGKEYMAIAQEVWDTLEKLRVEQIRLEEAANKS